MTTVSVQAVKAPCDVVLPLDERHEWQSFKRSFGRSDGVGPFRLLIPRARGRAVNVFEKRQRACGSECGACKVHEDDDDERAYLGLGLHSRCDISQGNRSHSIGIADCLRLT